MKWACRGTNGSGLLGGERGSIGSDEIDDDARGTEERLGWGGICIA